MTPKSNFPEGTRVLAPGKDDIVKPGVIVDELSVMYFIEFDDGTDNFVYKVERQLRRIDDAD